MSNQRKGHASPLSFTRLGLIPFCLALLAIPVASQAGLTVNLIEADGTSLASVGFSWTLEEDLTNHADPVAYNADLAADPVGEVSDATMLGLQSLGMHRSYMPVVATGTDLTNLDDVDLDDDSWYYISVLPEAGYTLGGAQITPDQISGGNATVNVVVHSQPVPAAQISLFVYHDNAPINNAWDTGELGLGGWSVFIYDNGGQLLTDFNNNPLGTVYDDDGNVITYGDGSLTTMSAEKVGDTTTNPYGLDVGELLIKNVAPGKYGVRVVAPAGEGWQQTYTQEGTPGQDVWVKAGEPRYFTEFGPAGHHTQIGFVKEFTDLTAGGGHTISGDVVNLRMSRPPDVTFYDGNPVSNCWVGLNDELGSAGLFATPCKVDASGPYPDVASHFEIPNVPDGNYQLVVWDEYLLNIFYTQSVQVAGGDVSLGNVPVFRWFGTIETYYFLDNGGDAGPDSELAGNGMRDPGESGIPDLGMTFHYRDGSIYAANVSDLEGAFPLEEAFPFFSWLVMENDFVRLKPTGGTVTVDNGGPVFASDFSSGVYADLYGANATTIGNAVEAIGEGNITPQFQLPPSQGGTGTNCLGLDDDGGPCLTRTELGAASLIEAYDIFIGGTTRFEWGRQPWGTIDLDIDGDGDLETVNENGGISGIVHYATVRAEDDPRFAAAEDWEPGVPRAQVNLYESDADGAGTIIDFNGNGTAGELADVDNYPFCWSDPASDPVNCGAVSAMGPEDENRNPIGGDAAGCDVNLSCLYDEGDAVEVAHTDSWDDNLPTECPAGNTYPTSLGGDSTADPFYFDGLCYDNLRNFNQARPAVFDGGFGFGMPFSEQWLHPGFYVVEANTPPGYELVKEEDKNVDFGDELTVNTLALPPICVGDDHEVPQYLSLFPGEVESAFKDQTRPLCDRKLVEHSDFKNTAADFFVFTPTPVTGHIQGFILNDLANEFDPNNPNFSEKWAPSHIPVSVRDYNGVEVYHTTSDAYGRYNAIVPSTYTMNIVMPSGMSPGMHQVCLNSPTRDDPANPGHFIADPYFNPQFSQFCYTFNFQPGQTTYLDTPVLPIAAYTGPNNWQLDAEYPEYTPVVEVIEGNHGAGIGPIVEPGGDLSISSVGSVQVPNPDMFRLDGANNSLTLRDYGFGAGEGEVWVGGKRVDPDAVTWTNLLITIDALVQDDETQSTLDGANIDGGQLRIVRVDTPDGSVHESVHAISVIVHDASTADIHVASPNGMSIQEAVDRAVPGDIVLVEPGEYNESVIVTKQLQIQGAGAASTIINASQSPAEKMALWHVRANERFYCATLDVAGDTLTNYAGGLLPGQGTNTPNGDPATCGYKPNSGLFINDAGAGILIAPRSGAFTAGRIGSVDGLTITGSDQGGALVINGYADFFRASNLVVKNNQSTVGAAGIRVGAPSLVDPDTDTWTDADNDFVSINNNFVGYNGSMFEPGGGVGFYTGSDNYRLEQNYIAGNFAQDNGGGVAHYGLSNNGLIADNQLVFNQSNNQTVNEGGNGGGLWVGGHIPLAGGEVAVTAGAGPTSGSLRVLRNLIQGNSASSGDGGGVALQFVNGADVGGFGGSVSQFFRVDLFNNMIVNNVAGWAAGGVALADALNVRMYGNTIVNNDSTATAALAIQNSDCVRPDTLNYSCPGPAGVVARAHSTGLADILPDLDPPYDGGYSLPDIRNSIIAGNRSWYWEGASAAPGGFFPNGLGALKLASSAFTGGSAPRTQAYWDLAVISTDPSDTLMALNTIFTCGATVSGSYNRFVLGIDSDAGDADCSGSSLPELNPLFVAPYTNGEPDAVAGGAVPSATVYPGGEVPIRAAVAADEGGNFIDVHFGPLSTKGTDYHLAYDASGLPSSLLSNIAIDNGTPIFGVAWSPDFDRGQRPTGPGFDIGADEIYYDGIDTSGSVGNVSPLILLPADTQGGGFGGGNNLPQLTAYIDPTTTLDQFQFQVIAEDPNGDTPLSYSLGRCRGGGRGSNGCNAAPLPAGMAIGASSGLITWTNVTSIAGGRGGRGGFGGPPRFRITVSDPSGATDIQDFVLQVVNLDGPNAQNDLFQVTSGTTFSQPAPGVLDNDTNPSPGLMTAMLADTSSLAGTVSLDLQGGFVYTPANGFIGVTGFSYRARNDQDPTGDLATVTLERWLQVDKATYNPANLMGTPIRLEGVGQVGDVLTFVDDSTGNPIPGIVRIEGTPGSTAAWSVELSDANWTSGEPIGIEVRRGIGGRGGRGGFGLPPVLVQITVNSLLSSFGGSPLTSVNVQCPLDKDGDGTFAPGLDPSDPAYEGGLDANGNWRNPADMDHQNVVCHALAAGDGFSVMADGKELYGFSFNDVTSVPADQMISTGLMNANFPAPTMIFDQGDEVFLSLTNVGMLVRPDLFDPHTVHFHGFPNAAQVFDGVPDSSVAINQSFTLTYYYNIQEPGTFMYHCHVEATEHMQMGMLGNLYVRPMQDGESKTDPTNDTEYTRFVYNDNDGTTGYDVEYPIQIGSFDGAFHDASHDVQPLPFAEMSDDYHLLNGRGYPDTASTANVDPASEKVGWYEDAKGWNELVDGPVPSSQQVHSLIEATPGQRILLRISNLNVTQFYTLATTGLPMKVVGTGAHILRGPGGTDLYYETNSVTLGGGEAVDVLIDTTGLEPGSKYLLYSTNTNELSNATQDFGGMMTEIHIN